MIHRHVAMIAVVASFASAVRGDDKVKSIRHTFEFTLNSVIDTETSTRKDRLKNDTRVRYAYERGGTQAVLSLEEIELKMVLNEKPTLEAFMNRSRFHVVQEGSVKDITAASADAKLKAMLSDSFGAPLVRFDLDQAGNETKRTEVAGPGARAILNKELIANVRLFHSAYYPDKMKWDAPVEIGGGTGGTVVSGIVTYERLPAKKTDAGIAFRVTGEIQPDVQRTAAGHLVTKRSITGQQIFSQELNDWISAEWSIKLTTELDNGNKEASGHGTGTAVAKMKLVR